MRIFLSTLLGLMAVFFTVPAQANPWYCSISDDDIVYMVMLESREGYAGFCLCPADFDARGNQCGKRSAYLRPTPYTALCYPEQVTQEMVDNYRERHCPPEGRVVLEYY